MQGLAVLAGSLAQKPGHGGHTWVFLQYLLGFRRLGWDVLFLDRLEPEMCRGAAGRPCPLEDSTALRYFLEVMRRFGLSESFALAYRGERFVGLSRGQVIERVRNSAILLNVMGFFNDEDILAAAPLRAFLDIDPGFGQMWQDLGQSTLFRGHDRYVTIGENIGQPACEIPTCGIDWVTTPQPVCLEHWPRSDGDPGGPITSIASWRGDWAPVPYRGKTYGLRVHEFRKFVELPRRTGRRFELALDIHPTEVNDLALLDANRWVRVDPRRVANDPWAYPDYIRRSAAEFMVAKNMYVASRSGWFSDRSICYLASGRPVLAQDTGFGHLYPTGEGLLTFTTLEEAVGAVQALKSDYAGHARAARAIAAEYFDSDKVLTRLLGKLGVG